MASWLHNPVEQLIRLLRVIAPQPLHRLQGGAFVAGKGISTCKGAPGVDNIRLEAQRLPVGFDGLLVTAQIKVGNAEIIPVGGTIRLKAQGLPLGFDGLTFTSQTNVRIAEVAPGLKVVRFALSP